MQDFDPPYDLRDKESGAIYGDIEAFMAGFVSGQVHAEYLQACQESQEELEAMYARWYKNLGLED